MPRYIDADKLIAHLKDEIKECEIPFGSRANGKGVAYGTALGLKSAISFVETLSTADVVPKSEYDAVVSAVDNSTKEFLKLHDEYQGTNAEIERLKHILDCYALQYGTVKEQQAVIDKANQELAREIFAEIDSMIFGTIIPNDCAIISIANLAEFKKKYTGG